MTDIYNDSTGGITTAWKLVKYNAQAVQEAIDRDKTIGKKEAKLIHALLKGREKFDSTSERGEKRMIAELKAFIIEYQKFYDLETLKEARKYIRKDLKYIDEQEIRRKKLYYNQDRGQENIGEQSVRVFKALQ